MGFYCPDVEDIVQETLTRFLTAARDGKILNPEAIGAFTLGVCRNVISEFRRRNLREGPIPEVVADLPTRGLAATDAFELRQAIAHGLDQLPIRDRNVLRVLSKGEIQSRDPQTDGFDRRELPGDPVQGKGKIPRDLFATCETSRRFRSLECMGVDFHGDPVIREELILRYLERRLDTAAAVEWESHYLGCTSCFEEIRATELLIHAIGLPVMKRGRIEGVTVLRFARGAQLLASSLELSELAQAVRTPNETKVLIDLSKVSRIDSSGLGVLMSCYCHALHNAGSLKLLNPEPRVRQVLSVARVDSLLETFEDEAAAIHSFRTDHSN